jgi:regulator of nucleoside diphosphate kinase
MDFNARATPKPPIVTELDAARICELATRLPGAARSLSALHSLIDMITSEADIVPAERIAADVVTVNSTVSFEDSAAATVHTVTLVYPQDLSIAHRRISVLSPVGQALLGRKVGDSVRVGMPDGSHRQIDIVELHYQPEAAGNLML